MRENKKRTVICPQCRKEFKDHPNGRRKYCSRGCYYQSETVYGWQDKVCLFCEVTFRVGGNQRTRKYCSYACSVKDRDRPNWHKWDLRTCPNCGKEFRSKKWSAQKYCCFKCSCLFRRGKSSGQKCRGSKRKTNRKVLRMTAPDGRKIFVHRYVLEQHLGRHLKPTERVHHINIDSLDNRLQNLYLCENKRRHQYTHRSIDKLIPLLLEAGVIKFEEGSYVMA